MRLDLLATKILAKHHTRSQLGVGHLSREMLLSLSALPVSVVDSVVIIVLQKSKTNNNNNLD